MISDVNIPEDADKMTCGGLDIEYWVCPSCGFTDETNIDYNDYIQE
jgi:hypothetical protein